MWATTPSTRVLLVWLACFSYYFVMAAPMEAGLQATTCGCGSCHHAAEAETLVVAQSPPREIVEQEKNAGGAVGSCQAGEHHHHHHDDDDDPAHTHHGAGGGAATKCSLASTPEQEKNQPSTTQATACGSGCQHEHTAHVGTPDHAAAAAPSGGCGHGHHHHGPKWDWDTTIELRAFVFVRDLFRRINLRLRHLFSVIAKKISPKPKPS